MVNQINEVSIATMRNWSRNGKFDLEKKLQNRANKRLSVKRFIPEEYIKYQELIELVYECFFNLGYTLEEILFSLILNLTKNVKNIFLKEELALWNITHSRIVPCLIDLEIKSDGDILGGVYQSLLTEGEKNKKGAYYTPDTVVLNQVNDYYRDGLKIIDPCCGTGQYLINICCSNPLDIWGADIDVIAVRIARINIMIKYSDFDFRPNIFHLDSLHDKSKDVIPQNYFDVVVTNPPWGAKVESVHQGYSIKSGESFSYFIEMGLNILKEGGILSFILPESILNVKAHEDVRRILLMKQVLNIYELGRIFSGVFTKAIRLDVKNVSDKEKNTLYVHTESESYQVDVTQFYQNPSCVFSIHISEGDKGMFDRIYQRDCLFLNNDNSLWALGIVTGDNDSFISDKLIDGFIPVYTGKEVKAYKLLSPQKYLLFQPERFQQLAPIERYTASPKLIYKFISKRLVFALDEEGVFTLNSANIIIPNVNYPIKVIAALFNSELYQYIFQKKFNSIKVLKSHIQEMPLPILSTKNYEIIEQLFDEVVIGKKTKEELDSYIFNLLT